MKFFLNDKQRLLGEAAVERIELRAFAVFAKFSDYVKSIDLTVEDVNGPRGGMDKVCKILVRLRNRKDVVVKSLDDSASKVVAAAIERASRSVGRKVNRNEFRNTRRVHLKA